MTWLLLKPLFNNNRKKLALKWRGPLVPTILHNLEWFWNHPLNIFIYPLWCWAFIYVQAPISSFLERSSDLALVSPSTKHFNPVGDTPLSYLQSLSGAFCDLRVLLLCEWIFGLYISNIAAGECFHCWESEINQCNLRPFHYNKRSEKANLSQRLHLHAKSILSRNKKSTLLQIITIYCFL